MGAHVVPTDTPGYELVRKIPVMGHEGHGWGTHCETRWTDVRVPVANTLGAPGDGEAHVELILSTVSGNVNVARA